MSTNLIHSVAFAQELIPVLLPLSVEDPGFIPYKIPQTPFSIFILFLLPIVMVIFHVLFTLKYWKGSGKIFKFLNSAIFVPLIFFSLQSMYYGFIFHRLLYEVITLYYVTWPFYALLVLFWAIKFFKQKRYINIVQGDREVMA